MKSFGFFLNWSKENSTISEQVYEFETEVSGEEEAQKFKPDIDKLTTIEEVRMYYGEVRGWSYDSDYRELLLDLLLTLK